MFFSPIVLLVFAAASTAVGFLAAYEYGKSTKAFKWSEYCFLVVVGLIAPALVMWTYGERVILFFFTSIVVGMCMEHLIGYLYHKTLNRRLWRYFKYTIGGYTSLLVAPFWGMAGIFFLLLGQVFGI